MNRKVKHNVTNVRLIALSVTVLLVVSLVFMGGVGTAVADTLFTTISVHVVDPPYAPGPQYCGVDTTTNRIYVPGPWTDSVDVLDGLNNTRITTTGYPILLPVGSHPYGVAVDPGLHKVFVGNYGQETGSVYGTTVSVIDTSTDPPHVEPTTITVGQRPRGITVDPVLHKVFVANYQDNSVSVINGSTETLEGTVSGLNSTWDVAVNTTSQKAYAGGYVIAYGSGPPYTAAPITMTSNWSYGVCVNPLNNKIYIPDYTGHVAVVDGATNNEITGPGYPIAITPSGDTQDISFNPTTNKAYVVNAVGSNTCAINCATDTQVGTSISTGTPSGCPGINPLTNRIYVAASFNDTVTVIDDPNPTPTINPDTPPPAGLSPNSAVFGGLAFTLTVNGTGFIPGSLVKWKGDDLVTHDRTTHYVSDTQITAEILAHDIAAVGTAEVTVFNPTPGGGTSTPARTFNIVTENPEPTATLLSPDSRVAGLTDFTLEVDGTGFIPSSQVKWKGDDLITHDRTTHYASSTKLTADILAHDIAAAGTAEVTVFNPTPGGGTSGALTFDINTENPSPTATSLSPISKVAGTGGFTLTVNGTDFLLDSVVKWDGTARTTTLVSGHLEADILAADILTAGGKSVTVFNPAPVGGTSGTLTFTANNPVPVADILTPASTIAGTGGFTLQVNGGNFLAGSVVRWNGANRDTTYGTPAIITASIPASDILTAGTANVTVFNPTPGGGPSTPALTFTINNPVPTTTSISPSSATAGDPAFTLTVNGTNFVAGSVVKWNTAARTTTYASGTQLTAAIPASDIATAGTAAVTVFNPGPGGGTSSAWTFTINPAPVPAPTVTSVDPTSGPPGTSVTITGDNFGSSQGAGKSGKGASYVSFNGVAATQYESWSNTRIVCTVPQGATPGPVVVVTGAGSSNADKTFTVVTVASSTWYLAEGTTDWGFSEYITIENPNPTPVTAHVTYMTKSGPKEKADITLPAASQTTVNPKDDIGATDFSTQVTCTDGKTIAVDRTMTWTGPGAASPEAHNSVGVTSPEKTWYLAEGSSDWGFECWLLIQNPNASEATATVTYMIEGSGPKTFEKKVPASSRATFNMKDDIGAKDASIKVEADIPVIPERAMYRNNRREGHDSIGTTAPASDYFLAEGTTDYGFTTYVLVQNPNPSAANVTVTYMTNSGPQPQAPFSMPANSRKTIRVNDVLPSKDLSTQVHADQPIIAERAMYWDKGSGEACHDSIGMDSPHTTFYLPDGQSSEGRETWTLVQNPNAEQVTVEVTYMTPTGAGNVVKTETIPASSRRTFGMLEHSGINGRAAIMVASTTAGKKIMVERAMYWNSRGAGTDTIGGYSD